MNAITHLKTAVLAFALSVLLFFTVSSPELHHFDDFSYLYAAQTHSIHALTHGEFESSNVAGFYNTKIGHVVLLKGLVDVFGDGLATIAKIEFIYSLLIVLSALAFAATLSILFRIPLARSLVIGGLYLVVPVTVYFASKLLAEGPAMLWATLSLLTLALALRSEVRNRRAFYCFLSAALLVMSIYSRVQLLLFPLGMWAALLVVPPENVSRKEVVITAGTVCGLTAVLLLLTDWLFDFDLMRGMKTATVVAAQSTYWRAKVFKVFTAFGPFVAFLPVCLLMIRRKEARFLLVWFICATAPFLLAFGFLETRWLLVGAPALAGLAYLCLEWLWQVLRGGRFALLGKALIVSVTVLGAAWSNHRLQSKTEYGLDEIALTKVEQWVATNYPGSPVLVPWTHSDFHYLRFAYPDKAIYAVNTASFFTPTTYITDAARWPEAMQGWYGARYVGDYQALKRTGPGPWISIAWNRAPGAWDGFKTSWIADDPNLTRVLVHRQGPYQVHLLEDHTP